MISSVAPVRRSIPSRRRTCLLDSNHKLPRSISDAAPAVELADGPDEGFAAFAKSAESGNVIPMFERLFSDQLSPVLAYRCLVKEDDRDAPSFLFESVTNGDQSGRFTFLGAQPEVEVVAQGSKVTVLNHTKGTRTVTTEHDPMRVPEDLSRHWRPVAHPGLPDAFCGGWAGYCGYDTVRYVYSKKLKKEDAPIDDRNLAEMHLGLYKDVVVFDNVTKIVYAVHWVQLEEDVSLEEAYATGRQQLHRLITKLQDTRSLPHMGNAKVELSLNEQPELGKSNMTKQQFIDNIGTAQDYIAAGDIFQVVLSQRFERRTFADPFEIYRSLRIVNPSPYMIYLQARGCILVASSPEILCRVDNTRTVFNRPLAGTRKRGKTDEDDRALEKDLLADEKERAEHTMLVDLGRNDVGKVAIDGSVKIQSLMDIERYSHVMHISSTVTGELKPELTSWDAMRSALPAGTVSGAPKVRAMQIIDELEVAQRGPYGGGVGFVSFSGAMDMALALRTMVIPSTPYESLFRYGKQHDKREWLVHLQSGAGIVADSDPESEYQETVNKAAALGRAIDLAEQAFLPDD